MDKLNRTTQTLRGNACLAGLTLLMIFLLAITSNGQDYSAPDYSKKNMKHQHAAHKKHENRLVHACGMLSKKRNYIPHKSFLASGRKPRPNMAERSTVSVFQIDKSEVMADASSKSIAKPVEKKATGPMKEPKIEHISDKQLEVLHENENEVLANNKLPLPTSLKQEEVRKRVADKLASKTNVYPLILDPLYFQFNQDEFSVVDMEPFLMAVEYALQGRTVLIEGHTDNRGQDDFNVKLSIKRVQKIRQLMLDMGVPDERISLVGYGEELSNKKTKGEADHQLNRKVDFTIF